MKNITDIITHSGPFHADDVIGVSILRTLFPKAIVHRTREQVTLQRALEMSSIAMVDVGGVGGTIEAEAYNNFDHHQREGGGPRDNHCPYAAAGLVWKKFGEDYIKAVVPDVRQAKQIAEEVDSEILQFVDAVDNGALVASKPTLKFGGSVRGCSISTLVHLQNPSDGSKEELDNAFHLTVLSIGSLFKNAVRSIAAKVAGEEGVRNRVNQHLAQTDTPIIVFDDYASSWQHIVCIVDVFGKILFAVFKSPDETWMVQQVPKAIDSFDGRKPLPEEWAGLRDEELQAVTKVPDAVFCHRGRFICGAKSKEGALALARLAVLA